MEPSASKNQEPLDGRVAERVRRWGLVLEDAFLTPTAFVGMGVQGDRPVVLKVLREGGDEWRSGAALEALAGDGVVRLYDAVEGALLLERLRPGTPLARVALDGDDDAATEILADVIRRIDHPRVPPPGFPDVAAWGEGFTRYLAGGDGPLPRDLVEHGRAVYAECCAAQRAPRLLHGDLQHYNVLFDAGRGWVAVDPKGVVGELEFEIGASLRNPYERPALFDTPTAALRRITRLAALLRLDAERILEWAFAQAVLSAIWCVEDGVSIDAAPLALARALHPLLV